MLYAIIGIPLTLLTITNLGGFMATAFRFLYKNICCGLCCLCCPSSSSSSSKRHRRRRRPPSPATDADEKAASDGGPGAQRDRRRRRRSTQRLRRNRSESVYPEPVTDESRAAAPVVESLRERLRRVFVTDDIKTVTVPIYVSLLLITGYIALGALLFMLWEKEWTYLIGCYFCFITLSTIGFGDYVPGTSLDAWNSQEKLVLCALYLLVGLALIAMCFDLMQEQARNSFKKLGQKLGLIDKHDES